MWRFGLVLLAIGIAADLWSLVMMLRAARAGRHESPLLLVPLLIYGVAGLFLEAKATWNASGLLIAVVLVSFHLLCQIGVPLAFAAYLKRTRG